TETEEYENLPADYPVTLTPQRAYRAVCGLGQYEPVVSKATSLSLPSNRYIHAILTRSVSGRGDSTGLLNRQDLLYLYSMVKNVPLHLGYVLAEYLRHQGQYARVGVIFAGPFITRLLIGMGLRDGVRRAEKTVTPAPITLETLRLMGIARRDRSDGIYILKMHRAQGEGSQPALQLPSTEIETQASPTTASDPPPVQMFSPSRGQDRLERLESTVGTIQTEVAEGRATWAAFHREVMGRFDRDYTVTATGLGFQTLTTTTY
ncbi:hypothetical protein, partial [Bartonella sp. CL5QHWL]|uniref:hypothetical protein n=1 Tax=Bartonella sp. CL5QHWL TaxID=3243537 RepID=UPI0035CEBE8D